MPNDYLGGRALAAACLLHALVGVLPCALHWLQSADWRIEWIRLLLIERLQRPKKKGVADLDRRRLPPKL